jgi:hypothetical protein
MTISNQAIKKQQWLTKLQRRQNWTENSILFSHFLFLFLFLGNLPVFISKYDDWSVPM